MGLAGFNGGFIGVDVFLVVSGYVITLSLLKQPVRSTFRNLAKFWAGRFVRIFPAAALVICLTVVAAFFLQGKAFDEAIFTDAKWATLYATNFRLIDSGANYFIVGLEQSLFTHYWALAVEQQFYVVYPVIVFGLTWIGKPQQRIWILRTFLLLTVLASATWSYLETLANPVSAYFSPFTRFWELATGGLIATFIGNKKYNWLGYLGLLVIAFSLFYLNGQSVYPGLLAWIPVVGTSLVLLFPLKFLGIAPLRYIGDISYSLYLWHFIWLVLPLQIENPITDEYSKWLFLAGAVACAVLSYHFFERPIHRSLTLHKDKLSAFLIGAICLAFTWFVISLIENLWLRSI
jgi:peptidoglycan/LPS O-acetylase OafA/YrhL